jgi:hypothetical protein
MGLKSSTAKRMFRFMDKRFHHKPDWVFDLKELAHEHIGLGRHYEGPSHLKRNLTPAISELESVGFLEPLAENDRFFKEGKDWKIRLLQKSAVHVNLTVTPDIAELPPLVAELIKRGVSAKSSAELIRQHPSETIRAKIEVFDWLVEKQDKRIAKSPEGYLVKSICDDYKEPKGFISTAQRQKNEETRRAREQQSAAERRRLHEAKDREKAERDAVATYWNALTPEQQTELQAVADAQANPASLAKETGPFKRMGQQIRREAYIRQLLKLQLRQETVSQDNTIKVNAYWESLSPEQQAETDAKALAEATTDELNDSMSLFFRTSHRHRYIEKLLRSEGQLPDEV